MLPCGRQLGALIVTLKEGDAKLCLQLGDVVAQRGLGEEELGSRFGKALDLGNGDEGFQFFEFHGPSLA